MQNNIKIAKYIELDNDFEKIGYDEYIITYLRSNKAHQLKVVINGKISSKKIDITNPHQKYKDIILAAISEYKHGKIKDKNIVKKMVKMHYIIQTYSKNIINNIQKHLLPINKEESRDKLTEFNLI